jgi:hypothetical protein
MLRHAENAMSCVNRPMHEGLKVEGEMVVMSSGRVKFTPKVMLALGLESLHRPKIKRTASPATNDDPLTKFKLVANFGAKLKMLKMLAQGRGPEKCLAVWQAVHLSRSRDFRKEYTYAT